MRRREYPNNAERQRAYRQRKKKGISVAGEVHVSRLVQGPGGIQQYLGYDLRLRFRVLRRDGFQCRICGRKAEDGARLEVDHIIPRSKGGSDTMDNLQTLCWACNQGKSDLFMNPELDGQRREVARITEQLRLMIDD